MASLDGRQAPVEKLGALPGRQTARLVEVLSEVVLGIDWSTTAVDVVLLDDDSDRGEWRRYPIATKPKDSFKAARLVRDAMPPRSFWKSEGLVLVGIEKPYSRNRETNSTLMRVQGAILACLPMNVPVFEFAANEWQPFFVGGAMAPKSKARKRQVRDAMLGRAGLPMWADVSPFDDACDAYGLAWTAREKWETGRVAA